MSGMMARSMRLTIRASSWCPEDQAFLMADTSHPEVDPLTPIPDAEAHVLFCHPSAEGRLRDAWAVLQERPQWWTDLARLQQIMGLVAGGQYDIEVAGLGEGVEEWLAATMPTEQGPE